MKHVSNIRKLLRTMLQSERFHALVVVSPPGWAKSTTIDAAIAELEGEHHAIGAYTTPLALYNAICGHPSKLLVLDDCAGLFTDQKSMAILKAATWASAGVGDERRVAWSSTSDKVTQSEIVFRGKMVLLTNVLPGRSEAQAFFSRTMLYRIQLEREDIKGLLIAAARSQVHFSDTNASGEVAEFLVETVLPDAELSAVNLRTLHLGYELRAANPDDWRELLAALTVMRTYDGAPEELVRELAESSTSVAEQEAAFCRATGLSRRSFFHYRRRLGLSRAYALDQAPVAVSQTILPVVQGEQ